MNKQLLLIGGVVFGVGLLAQFLTEFFNSTIEKILMGIGAGLVVLGLFHGASFKVPKVVR